MSTIKNDTLENDEFDVLLNDFLQNELNSIEQENQDAKQKSGNEEVLENAPSVYNIDNISIRFNGDKMDMDCNEFYANKNEYNAIIYEIEFDQKLWGSKVKDTSALKPISVSVVDLKTGKIISNREIKPLDGSNERCIDFDYEFTSGSYKIVMTNCTIDWLDNCDKADFEKVDKAFKFEIDKNGNQIIEHYFTVYPDGHELEAPELLDVYLEFDGEICGTKRKPALHFVLNSEQKLCRYSAECYAASGVRMGVFPEFSGEDDIPLWERCYSTFEGEVLIQEMEWASYVWVDGEYYVILFQNDVPVYRFEFELTENHKGKVQCAKSKFTVEDEDYYKHSQILRREGWQDFIGRASAFRTSRDKLVRIVEMQEFEQKRSESVNAYSASCQGLAIISDGRDIDNLANAIVDKVVDLDCNTVDCTSLVERTTSGYNLGTSRLDEAVLEDVNVLKNISAVLTPDGIEPLNRIVGSVSRNSDKQLIFVCQSRSEFEQLVAMEPRIAKICPEDRCLSFDEMTLFDYMMELHDYLLRKYYFVLDDAWRKFYHVVSEAYNRGVFYKMPILEFYDLIEENVIKNYKHRMMKLFRNDDDLKYTEIIPSDIDADAFMSLSTNTFDEAMKPIDGMVGLTGLKEKLKQHFEMLSLDKMRADMGLTVTEKSGNHMLFTGNPGTGKTTVARVMGKVCHALGLLSKGEVVVTDRAHIVGQYIGDTERNMLNILNQARGNVLFIDEAYTLITTADDKRDFGRRALEVLLPVLSQKNPDMVVIFAGYKDKIEEMLNSNQGLSGRFPHHFEFPDYSSEELVEIGKRYIANKGYRLSANADRLFAQAVANATRNRSRDFYNARWVEQFVDMYILPSMAERLSRMNLRRNINSVTGDLLSVIEEHDVVCAFEKIAMTTTKRRSVGF